ncbi:hypothetical protein M408DRAFT_167251 [Serendipita vermifera MAFF 305830]|uniref:Uncharacterized protein n=1 Tax=Serendipita vermifera MAFF 305830 TaxID=933852 RepID=A0A0C3B5Y7_SERVB|nr:hypothetical protein M408DRAFT_167251 [Serendipita vermifera MAFF 305830]
MRVTRAPSVISYSLWSRQRIPSLKQTKSSGHRQYTQDANQARKKERSRHASWYSDTLPSMIPISLLGFTIYGLLELTRLHLAREKQLLEHVAKIDRLQTEIDELTTALQAQKAMPVTQTPSIHSEKQSKSFWKLW